MPTPLRAAAMVPATWVPWSLVVGSQPVVLGRPASTQLTEFATSRLATRSGWSASMPLSSTPTSTLREPSVILWAWSALIICMSHCSAPQRVAAGVARGRDWASGGRPRRSRPRRGPCRGRRSRRPTRRLSRRPRSANAGLVERATSTPIWSVVGDDACRRRPRRALRPWPWTGPAGPAPRYVDSVPCRHGGGAGDADEGAGHEDGRGCAGGLGTRYTDHEGSRSGGGDERRWMAPDRINVGAPRVAGKRERLSRGATDRARVDTTERK